MVIRRLRSLAFCASSLLGGALSAWPGDPLVYIPEAKLLGRSDPGGQANDFYGQAVAVSGDTMVVAAPFDETAIGFGAGSVIVFARVGSTWVQQQRLVAPFPGSYEGQLFGSAVAIDGDTLVVGDRGSVHVYERSDSVWTRTAGFLPDTPDLNAGFGEALSLSGDTLAVGLPLAPPALAGAVYVYERTAGAWSFQQRLQAAGAPAGGELGRQVATSSGRIVAGAPYTDTAAGTDAGVAFAFVKAGGTWVEETRFESPGATPGAQFGRAVALSGDTALMGAPLADGPGSAYTFVRSNGVWSPSQPLVSPESAAGESFGFAVALEGDVAVVGAPWAGAGGSASGGAYLFRRSGGVFSPAPKIVASNGNAGDYFGLAVAISEDAFVVGAPFKEGVAGEAVGAAYAFDDGGSTFVEHPLVPDHGTEGSHLGLAVAVEGDTAVAGAPGASTPAGPLAGYAYVFVRSGASWTEQQRLQAPDATARDFFGGEVALSGDTLVVGAPWAESGIYPNAGVVYVFVREGGAWTFQQKLEPERPSDLGFYGSSLAVSGDTIVVGDSNATVQGTAYQGRAHVYVRSGNAWSLQQTLVASDGGEGEYFGQALDLEQDTLVVGALLASAGGVRKGAAYVFTRAAGAWTEGQKLSASDGTAFDRFGRAISLSGNTLVVSTEDDASGVASGSAYIFERVANLWTEQQKLLPSGLSDNSQFAASVALDGDVLVAKGASFVPAGVGYLYRRNGSVWEEEPDLEPPDAAPNDRLTVFAISGDTIAGGMPIAASGGTFSGAAWIFARPRADLAVSLKDGQAQAVPGTAIEYTLVASNAGVHPVASAHVVATLPPALLGASWLCTGTGGAVCAGGTGAVDDFASLPPGSSATYTLSATIDPAATGTLMAVADVSVPAGYLDPNLGNNQAQDVDALTPRADLAVSLASVPTAAGSGASVTWYADLANQGESTATAPFLSHQLAANATLVSFDPPPPTCSASPGAVTCGFGALPPAEGRRLTVVQRVDGGFTGSLSTSATVTGSEPDPVSSNNAASLVVPVIAPGDEEIAHGTSRLAVLREGASVEEDLYRISQRPQASYEVVVDSTSGDIGASGVSLSRASTTGVLQDAQPVGSGPSRSLRWENLSTTVVDDQYVRVASTECATDCGPEDVYRLRAYETTLSGPRFNNVGSQATIVILQNATAGPVSGHIHFRNAQGALLATESFVIQGHGVSVLATASLAALAGQSGSLTVSHDAPYGGLVGKAVSLEPATGFSFDTPLSPRR